MWDNEQQVPFAYRDDQWVGFDDERSLINKVIAFGILKKELKSQLNELNYEPS